MIAFIPAKEHSTRLEHKNYLSLNGKPLILYTIEALKKAKKFLAYSNNIIVSTDSEVIKTIAENAGVSVVGRSKSITSSSTIMDVFDDFLTNQDTGIYEIYGIFPPTAPLRSANDIDEGIKLYLKYNQKIVSVTEYSSPPQFACRMVSGKLIIDENSPLLSNQTQYQQHETLYHPNGSFYIGSIEEFRNTKSFFDKKVIPYVMPKERSIDINEIADFKIAEYLIRSIENG